RQADETERQRLDLLRRTSGPKRRKPRARKEPEAAPEPEPAEEPERPNRVWDPTIRSWVLLDSGPTYTLRHEDGSTSTATAADGIGPYARGPLRRRKGD